MGSFTAPRSRPLIALIAALALAAVVAAPRPAVSAGPLPVAAETEAEAKVELPERLTQPQIRDLVSRLSDTEVRDLLIRQLDKAALADEARVTRTDSGVEQAFADAQDRFHLMLSAVPRLPRFGSLFVDRLTEGKDRSYIWTVLLFAVVVFGGAATIEALVRRLFKQFGETADEPRPSLMDRTCILMMRLMRDVLALGVFGLSATGIFFALFEGHQPTQVFLGSVFWFIVVFRSLAAVARFALAPGAGWLRVPPISDDAARMTYRRVLLLVGTLAGAYYLGNMIDGIVVDPAFDLLDSAVLIVLVLAVFVAVVWRDRRAIRDMILEGASDDGRSPGRVRQLLAVNWHLFATGFLVLIGFMHMGERLMTGESEAAPIIASLCILFAIPILDWALRAGLTSALRLSPSGAPEPEADVALAAADAEGVTAALPEEEAAQVAAAERRSREERLAYLEVLLKNLRIVLAVIAVTILADVWDLDLESTMAAGVGSTVAGALFDIVITLILASAIWGIVRVAIRYAVPSAESESDDLGEREVGGKGGTRLETLVPLFGKFLLVTLVVIVVLIILSELGVDIGPLIAGAGVIGLAVGFGAQTLVRDILSGLFFLVDDAFRVGEYVDVGSVRGMVEHISIRSFRLRHHLGPVHTIPFGEITHLTNFSRDWAIMKLEMRVPFDTDLEKVRKIIKRVGQDMMADPEHGPNFLQPVKSQGVHRMDDSAFIVRVKFMAKPGEQFVLRREVFRRVQEAFADNGIRFAPKRVIVDTGGAPPTSAAAAAAAAAAIAEGDTPSDQAPEGPAQDL